MTHEGELAQPWDVIANYFTKAGYTLDEARDRTIIAWLRSGNSAPYIDWVTRGHTPAHRVAVVLARMMQKGKAPEAPDLADMMYGLQVLGDARTLPDCEGESRKFLAARHSMARIEQGRRSGKKSIIARSDEEAAVLASEVPLANNVTISAETVRQVRTALQRDMAADAVPEILRGLFAHD